ncbi:MAG TPA: class I SAM-dependent methyltransferase [Tepidisphaeraceae bacterium]|jgi:trans-aconitate methyltransferase|nr:class I SAM-dependent methyltransferase [Tepidisphaeraceae bacterium]
MDTRTLNAYDQQAHAFAEDWHRQPPPTDLQEIVRQYFRPGITADVGCGSGRETGWLAENGFAAIGIDPSEGLLEEARRRHPGVRFVRGGVAGVGGCRGGIYECAL